MEVRIPSTWDHIFPQAFFFSSLLLLLLPLLHSFKTIELPADPSPHLPLLRNIVKHILSFRTDPSLHPGLYGQCLQEFNFRRELLFPDHQASVPHVCPSSRRRSSIRSRGSYHNNPSEKMLEASRCPKDRFSHDMLFAPTGISCSYLYL